MIKDKKLIKKIQQIEECKRIIEAFGGKMIELNDKYLVANEVMLEPLNKLYLQGYSIEVIARAAVPVAFYVYEGHPLYNKDSVTLEELKNEEIITMNEKFHIYHDFISACKARGFEPKIKAKTMDGQTLFKMVSEKIGIAISPVCVAYDEPNVKKLILEGDYTWNIYGIYRKDSPEKELIESANSYFLNNPYFQ